MLSVNCLKLSDKISFTFCYVLKVVYTIAEKLYRDKGKSDFMVSFMSEDEQKISVFFSWKVEKIQAN